MTFPEIKFSLKQALELVQFCEMDKSLSAKCPYG